MSILTPMIYSAEWLLPITSAPIRKGQILVREGEIAALGRNLARKYPDEQVRELAGCAILPGFVNCHTHIELTCLRGRFDGVDFLSWLIRLGLARRAVPIEEIKKGTQRACAEMIAGGTTTIGEISSLGLSAAAIQQSGLRAVIYSEIIAVAGGEEDERVVREAFDTLPADTGLLCFRISPHTPFTVLPNALKLAGRVSRERGIGLAIHVAESKMENDIMHGRGKVARYLRAFRIPWSPPDVSPIAYLRDLGILSEKTLVVHCTQADSADLDMLAASGASVAHCPKSNAKLGHGIAPIRDMLQRGIEVGLGTDSAASNDRLDMFEEMRAAVLFARAREQDPRALSAAQVLRMATLGGAKALGLDDRIGSLEVGKRADFIAVHLGGAYIGRGFDPVSHIVFYCNPQDVRLVVVDGQVKIGVSGPRREC